MPATGAPVRVVESNDPAQPFRVINEGPVRVWLAEDGNVSPSYGVPLEAFTAIPWATPGEVWAVIDPGNAANAPAGVSVITTQAISDWTPSPVAIAVQTALEFLQTGVTQTFQNSVLWTGSLAPGASTPAIGIKPYSQLLIHMGPNGGGANGLPSAITAAALTQNDDAGNMVDQEYITAADKDAFGTGFNNISRISVVGSTATLKNQDSTDTLQTITIIGTNRPALVRSDSRQNAGLIQPLQGNTTAFTVGQTVAMYDSMTSGRQQRLQGLAYAWFLFDATLTGYYSLTDYQGTSMLVMADSTEAKTASNGAKWVEKLIALPAYGYTMYYTAQTAGTFAPECRLVGANI